MVCLSGEKYQCCSGLLLASLWCIRSVWGCGMLTIFMAAWLHMAPYDRNTLEMSVRANQLNVCVHRFVS